MKRAKYILINLTAIMLCFVLMLLLFYGNGWFTSDSNITADSDSAPIEEPPILYILDSDASDITQLSLSGLEIGVEKKIVFCVSSIYPVTSDGNGHRISFSLELAYTNNLNANFDLYSADIVPEGTADAIPYYSQGDTLGYFTQGTALDSEEVSGINNRGNIAAYGSNYSEVQDLNQLTFKQYITSSTQTDANFVMNFAVNGGTGLYDTTKCRFFILNITWGNFNAVDPKETDMIYILARGGGLS